MYDYEQAIERLENAEVERWSRNSLGGLYDFADYRDKSKARVITPEEWFQESEQGLEEI